MKGLVVVAHGLSCSLACGIFPDEGSNCVPRIGRQILNYWTTREVLEGGFLTTESSGKSLNVEFFVFRAGKLWDTRNLIFLRELVTLPHSY